MSDEAAPVVWDGERVTVLPPLSVGVPGPLDAGLPEDSAAEDSAAEDSAAEDAAEAVGVMPSGMDIWPSEVTEGTAVLGGTYTPELGSKLSTSVGVVAWGRVIEFWVVSV